MGIKVLNTASLNKFVNDKGGNYVLRLKGGRLFAEEKGFWTWVNSKIVDRSSYKTDMIREKLLAISSTNSKALSLKARLVTSLERTNSSPQFKVIPVTDIRNLEKEIQSYAKQYGIDPSIIKQAYERALQDILNATQKTRT